MSRFDRKKFVFHETFMNNTGKTSGSGFVGVILGLIGGGSFIATMVGYFLQLPNTVSVMGQILALIAAATILLGVRKVSGSFSKSENDAVTTPDPTEPDPNKG